MRNIYLAFIGGLLLTASCKKPQNPQPQDPPVQPMSRYVSKISNAENEFREYAYNDQHFLTKYTSQFVGSGGITRAETNYIYENAVITKAESPGGRLEYVVENGKVKATKYFTQNGTHRTTINYTYNAKGQLIEWVEHINNPWQNEPVESKQVYEYHPDGNVKRIEQFYRYLVTEPFISTGGSLFDQYDNKRNPELLLGTPVYLPGVTVMINNPKRVQEFLPNGSVHMVETLDYTYFADGMIATKKTSLSISPISITFSYAY